MSAPARLLAVDPGARACGVALFDGGRLLTAALVRNSLDITADVGRAASAACMGAAVDDWACGTFLADELALEWPRVYASRIRAGASRGDPNDLLMLSAVCGAVASRSFKARIYSYAPSEWKGQLPKPQCAFRVMSRLDDVEHARLELALSDVAASLRHNVYDAVGIGLHHLNRLGVRRST